MGFWSKSSFLNVEPGMLGAEGGDHITRFWNTL